MTRRLYIVGTDTDAGKTTVTCALLRAARRRGLSVLPFKPSCTGPLDANSDPRRLLDAAAVAGLTVDEIVVHHDPRPLAPGIAAHGTRTTWATAHDHTELIRAERRLKTLEARYKPDLVMVEGAGGLRVPFPGPSWQVDWIRVLAPTPLVVGRTGLGTLNHTLLTIEALRRDHLAPIGFLLNEARPDGTDLSARDNPQIIADAARLPHLGTYPHLRRGDPDPAHWLTPQGITTLFSAPS